MIKCLRPLVGKIDIKKLTMEEWNIVGENTKKYADNSATFGLIFGIIIGLVLGIAISMH